MDGPSVNNLGQHAMRHNHMLSRMLPPPRAEPQAGGYVRAKVNGWWGKSNPFAACDDAAYHVVALELPWVHVQGIDYLYRWVGACWEEGCVEGMGAWHAPWTARASGRWQPQPSTSTPTSPPWHVLLLQQPSMPKHEYCTVCMPAG